ncbi:hypothetical protein M3147_08485 [Agromyces mediolanus]|uniref:hypothetical protein n=1 Tax=Agromyces mediolanus TaxID=41986 RepID=UPI002041A327|nr:hypothetical protein [Agromyces mediolanus]MCM3657286.1 hypothetical protein [Agromyces mediolanus]
MLGSVGAALAAALQAISWAAVAGLGSGITILSMSGDSSDSRANAEAAKDAAAADISTPATPPDDDDPCNLFESLDCIGDGTSEVGFPRNSVDDILASGLSPRKGNLTNAGREYQKHMGRGGGGELPHVQGKDMNTAGQELLENILTSPTTRTQVITTGRARGGTVYIRGDGIGAAVDKHNVLQYFGVFK